MTQVKICGLSTPDTMTAALEDGADFVGLVFYPPSPRHVELEVANYLTGFVPDHIQTVGLFVDPDDQLLTSTLDSVSLDMIQLHGKETSERVTEIKEKFGLPVIKALSISNALDVAAAAEYEVVSDWLLFDAKGEELPGGNGLAFDWGLLSNYQSDKPWMLAGGLTPDNVLEALSIASPTAVDVSSGVESARGTKDAHKIQAFLQAVKKA